MEIENEQNRRTLCEIAQTLFVGNFTCELSEPEILTKMLAEFGYTERKSQNSLRALRDNNILLVVPGKKDIYKLQTCLAREAIANCL